MLLLASPAMAGTPIGKEQAQAFYQNCLQQPSQNQISAETQELVCACTAAHMMDHMEVEDIQKMARQAPDARTIFNKMVVNVYAPCIEYPAREYHYNECVNNPKTKTLASRPEALCGCMADEVASYLSQNAQPVFRDLLARNPDMQDPLGALVSDPEFTRFAQSKLMACYTKSR